MPTTTQYCWLKVTRQVDAPAPANHFALWALRETGGPLPDVSVFIEPPPTPHPADRLKGMTSPPCPPCFDRKLMASDLPADLPDIGLTLELSRPAWRMECANWEATGESPAMQVAVYPVGTNRDAARGWIESSEGEAWVDGALAVTLLSFSTTAMAGGAEADAVQAGGQAAQPRGAAAA